MDSSLRPVGPTKPEEYEIWEQENAAFLGQADSAGEQNSEVGRAKVLLQIMQQDKDIYPKESVECQEKLVAQLQIKEKQAPRSAHAKLVRTLKD